MATRSGSRPGGNTEATASTASAAVSVFVSLAFAAVPNLLMAEVSASDTGVANSVNSIVRTVGTSIASAVLTTMLATYTIAGTSIPQEVVYTVAFVFGAVSCVIVTLSTVGATRM